MTRAALYARVSTRDKKQEPEVHMALLRAFAATRGWEAVEFVDQAPAGDIRRRTAWRRLLTDAEKHRFDLVLVLRLDRAFRSVPDTYRTLADLDHWGVGFVAHDQPGIDTSSPSGKLVLAVLAAASEFEHDLLASRVKEGMDHARAQGARLGRPRVVERPGFAKKWATVQPQVLAGTLSKRQAAKRLRIGPATLDRLLQNGVGSAG